MIFEINIDDVLALDDSGTLTEAKAALLTEDVMARAGALVPELYGELTEPQAKAASAILRRVILRSAQTGSGAVVQQSVTTGAYSESQTIDNKSTDRGLFMKHEIEELKNLFPKANSLKGRAFYLEPF